MNAMKTRTETDSMGPVEVPADALYGAQTQRALNNFTISARPLPDRFLRALLLIKRAAAAANRDLGLLDAETADAIIGAVETLLAGELTPHFPVPILQTGSGTSSNMNANEVLATIVRRSGRDCSANDQINMSQSSNDVIPTTLHVAAAQAITQQALPSLTELAATIRAKGRQYRHVVKTGRTHLMDALPIRFEQELGGWAAQIDDNIDRLQTSLQHLLRLPLGGTAVGSGVNCHPRFAERARFHLARLTGLEVRAMASNYLGLSCLDTVLETSGQLKTCAATLMKIANDLRLMNSGPGSGLGEITLPALQPGSSIMPDKVNPVIAEAVCMAAARVIGNDASITIAAQSGNFQLNTMLPLAAADVLESIALIGGAARDLGDKAIAGLTLREERLREPLAKNPILVTALAPYIGYLSAAVIAKTARQQHRTILDVAREMTELAPELLERLLDPVLLADGGSPPTDNDAKRRER
jgi:fumarate hydratase class II